MHVIGNYMHHNYRGTWSQGFNLYSEDSRATPGGAQRAPRRVAGRCKALAANSGTT